MQEIDDQESIKTSLKGMFELMRIMHEKILKIEVEQERQKFDRILSESINSLSSFSNQGPSWLKEQYTRAQNDKAVMVDRATSPLRELPSTQDIPRRSPSSLGNHHLFSDATSTTYTLGTKINSSYSMHIGNTSTVNTLTELPNNISKGKQTFSLAESSNSTQQTHLTENDLRTINPAVITAATSTKSLSPEVNNVDDTEDTASTATSLDPRLSEKQADSPDIDSFADHTADLPEIFADPPPRTDAFDWYLQSSHAINTATSIQPAGIIRRSFPSRTPIPRVIPADTSSRSSSPEQTLVEMNSYNQLPTTTTYETNNPSPAQASPNASTVPPSPLIFSSEPTDKQAKMEPSSGSSQSEKSTTGESEADETAEYLAVSSPSTSSTSSATPPPKGKYKRKPRYVDPSILSAPKVLRSGKAVDFLSDQELVRITQLAMADKKRLAEEQASNKLVARENRKRLAQERAHNRLVAKERAHEKRLARQTARNNQLAEAEKRRLARVKKEPHQAQQSSATNKDMMIEKKNAGSSSISNPTGISGRGRSKRWMVEMNKALSFMIHQRQMKKKELKSLLIAKKEKKKEAVGKKKSNEQQLQSSTQHERDLHERDQHEACSELHNIRNNEANNGEQDVEKPSDKYEEQDQFKGIKRLVEENPQPLTITKKLKPQA